MNTPVPWYLNPLLLAPAFGFLGVVIGGLITFGSSYFLDEHRAKRERQREDREHAREVRRAARLIALELLWMRTAANRCVEEKIWPNPDMPLLSLSSEARQKYLDAIAPNLSSDDWLSVTISLQAVDTFKMIIGMRKDRAIAVPDDVVESFVPLVANIDKGRLRLAPHEFA
jgi:hypothetical protein